MFKYLISKLDIRNENNSKQRGKLESQGEKFDRIISFAKSVLIESSNNPGIYKQYKLKGNDHPILDVIRLLGKNVQTKYLTSLLYYDDESDLPSLFPEILLFERNDILHLPDLTFPDLIKEQNYYKELYLNKDLVLPWPWKTRRLISTICNIGEHRKWGEWRQDEDNHYVELWLPIGIGWVYGGNHSIASGILQGTGKIIPTTTYNISQVYDYVYSDGRYYFRKEDNSVICPVKDVEFAAIFEIGRLMKKHSISF